VEERLVNTPYKNKGFYYFEDRKAQKKELSTNSQEARRVVALKKFEKIKKDFEEAVQVFTVAPSLENAIKLAILLEQQYKRGEAGEKFLKEAYLKYPQLSSAQSLASEALKIRRAEKNATTAAEILQAKQMGWKILICVKENCKYCEAFYRVARAFKEKYNYTFEMSTENSSITKRFNVKHFPTVFLYHDRLGYIYPVAYGYQSLDEFEESLLFVIQKIKQ
jgi:conjugal transfer pilus assembly protein TraF